MKTKSKPSTPTEYKLPKGHVLVMRTCNAELKAHNNFQWPASGRVKCPDWDPRATCGNGFHGLLWGEGNSGYLSWDPSAKALVVQVKATDIVDIDAKVKFPECVVVYVGDIKGAANFISKFAPAGTRIVAGTATAGNYGTATAGYRGTATAGNYGTATAGNYGTATAGNYGTATAGNYGTATAGYRGTATAGYRGTATAGESGTISIEWYDCNRSKYRRLIGEVGEDGLMPNTKYRVEGGEFVEVK